MLAPPGYAKMTSTPSRSRASTKMSRPNMVLPTSARFAFDFFLEADSVVLLIVLFGYGRHDVGQQKTHSRYQPWVLVKASTQQAPMASWTTTTSMATCEVFFNIGEEKLIVPSRVVKRVLRHRTKFLASAAPEWKRPTIVKELALPSTPLLDYLLT